MSCLSIRRAAISLWQDPNTVNVNAKQCTIVHKSVSCVGVGYVPRPSSPGNVTIMWLVPMATTHGTDTGSQELLHLSPGHLHCHGLSHSTLSSCCNGLLRSIGQVVVLALSSFSYLLGKACGHKLHRHTGMLANPPHHSTFFLTPEWLCNSSAVLLEERFADTFQRMPDT